MRKDERDVFFFDIQSESWHRKFQGIAPFPHKALAQAIKSLFDADRAVVINAKKQAIYIADMKVLPDRCEMLIGFSDTQAADPTFADVLAKKRRTEKKIGDEGIEHSAHIIWRYENANENSKCPFLLEVAAGLGSGKIQAFLNALLRESSATTEEFLVDDPEAKADKKGKLKRINTRPKIELVGHPSAEFLKDLRQGTLQEVELFTTRKQGTPWDAHGRVIEDRASVTIKPNPQKAVTKAKQVLDSFVPGKAKQFEFARIRFKTESDVTRTVTVQSQDYGLLNNAMYVRKERIDGIGDDLPTAFEKLYQPILARMRKL